MGIKKIHQPKLDSIRKKAFLNNSVNHEKLKQLKDELKKIPKNEKPIYKNFVELVIEDCRKAGIESGIKIEDFELNNFNKQLRLLVNSLQPYFENYKRYFITRLEHDPTKDFKILFLYDKSFPHKSIESQVPKRLNAKFTEIEVFEKENSGQLQNYLCVFLFASKLNYSEKLPELIKTVEQIIGNFKSFESYSFYGSIVSNKDSKKDFSREVEYTLSTLLSNAKLHFEEEKIIKKLCLNLGAPLVFYRTLNEGFSGAKVIEIRPKKTIDLESRYIIKYAKIIDGKTFLEKESRNFNKSVRDYAGLSIHNADYKYTQTHEGIIYNYAISQNRKQSYPFSEVLMDKDNPFHKDKIGIIKRLFKDNILFKTWSKSQFKDSKRTSAGIIYKDYINVEKIHNNLKLILNIDDDVLKTKSLYINFEKIWKQKLTYDLKTCHGDLHSDNFFIDETSVHLIDFGHTMKRHSVIDNTSLECSLKFRHFPLYIDINELIKIEEELLKIETFQPDYTFSSTNREELKDLLKVITTIRSHYPEADDLQYLISLFVMTVRQIQYSDMNQLYAYYSADIIGMKIVEILETKNL